MATSTSMQARLAAQVDKMAGGASDGGDIAMDPLGADESDTGTPIVETAADAAGDSPPREARDDAATAVSTTAEPETPEQAEAKARAKRLELFEEKLKTARERRHAARLAERATADRKAAKAEREQAAAERAKYDGLKEGSFKQTLETLGRDPRKTFEEMQREAIEASTPEAQAKRDREALQRDIDAKLTPMQQELERLKRVEAESIAREEHRAIVTNFTRAVADPAFKDLRVEYSDEQIFDHVRSLLGTPQGVEVLHETARKHNVQLTDPQKGFTMQEILHTLAAEQAAHDRGKQARRAAQSPAEPQSAQPTVNGTAPRRNAGTAIGNDLASQRATTKAEVPGLSPRERLRQRQAAEIRRGNG